MQAAVRLTRILRERPRSLHGIATDALHVGRDGQVDDTALDRTVAVIEGDFFSFLVEGFAE